jgi:hypothetical protein
MRSFLNEPARLIKDFVAFDMEVATSLLTLNSGFVVFKNSLYDLIEAE